MSQLPPPAYTPSTARTNTLAVVSLVSAVLSVFGHIPLPFIGGGTLALVAIVTGFVVRGDIKRSGEQGMWMATVGIVIGLLHFAALLLLVLLVIAGIFVIGGLALLHH